MFERIVAIVDGSETSHYAIGASITVAREDADALTFCVTIDPALSADGVGMTPRQSLLKVELPLALPVMMAGIRTAAVWVIGLHRGLGSWN